MALAVAYCDCGSYDTKQQSTSLGLVTNVVMLK
jgi:hypothetical protein